MGRTHPAGLLCHFIGMMPKTGGALLCILPCFLVYFNLILTFSMDEQGERKRKSFSGTSKQEVKENITTYIADFNQQFTASDKSKAKPKDFFRRLAQQELIHLYLPTHSSS